MYWQGGRRCEQRSSKYTAKPWTAELSTGGRSNGAVMSCANPSSCTFQCNRLTHRLYLIFHGNLRWTTSSVSSAPPNAKQSLLICAIRQLEFASGRGNSGRLHHQSDFNGMGRQFHTPSLALTRGSHPAALWRNSQSRSRTRATQGDVSLLTYLTTISPQGQRTTDRLHWRRRQSERPRHGQPLARSSELPSRRGMVQLSSRNPIKSICQQAASMITRCMSNPFCIDMVSQ